MNSPYSNAYYSGGRAVYYPTGSQGVYPTSVPPPPQGYAVVAMGTNNQNIGGGTDKVSSNSSARREDTAIVFSDKTIRRAFIRKVYILLSLQLLVTLGIIAIFVLVDPVKNFVQHNPWIWILCSVVFVGTYIALVCCENNRRQTPKNYVFLAILTLALSGFVGSISSFYKLEIVLLAVGITALVTIALTLFAIQTKIDFTLCSGMIFVATIVVFIFGFAVSIAHFLFGYNRILDMVYSAVSALLFCWYLVFDTQMLIGGRRHSLSEEEYVYAATQIYVDIVMIFMDLLSLLGNLQ